MDTVNSGVTTGSPSTPSPEQPLATRLGTNAVTNIMQGSAKYAGHGYSLFKDLSEADRRRAWAAAGQHGFMSMPHEGVGRVGAMATKGAQFWAHRADAMRFRFQLDRLYEARKEAGYRTPAQFRDFLGQARESQRSLR